MKIIKNRFYGVGLSFTSLVSLFLLSCSSGNTIIPNNIEPNKNVTGSSTGQTTLPKPDHLIIVLLENKAETKIIGSSAAPYINQLANSGALFTQSYALAHPSQPNYIMLFSGSNQGVTNDNLPGNLPFNTPNLASSLLSKGFTFTGYSEDLPSVGFNEPTSGSYARKHNPWSNWQGSGSNNISANLNQPFSSFPNNYSNLPTVSFVIPNLKNDMHDGTVTDSDNWLKKNLDGYIQWANKNNSLFILTFDEDDRLHNNQIATIFSGQMMKQGQYNEKIDHYNVLRTIEDMYGLPYAGMSSSALDITDCWK